MSFFSTLAREKLLKIQGVRESERMVKFVQ
jgi:hypothetical protein